MFITKLGERELIKKLICLEDKYATVVKKELSTENEIKTLSYPKLL